MKLFLDTADIDEIREIAGWGILSGVTTNPSLMAQAGRGDYKSVTQEICYLVQGPINAEVVSLDMDGMIAEAKEIATWSPYVIVKIPTIEEGIKSLSRIRKLEVNLKHLCEGCPKLGECDTAIDKSRNLASKQGIRTNATLIFSATQALLAMIAGASYVSTFVGRLDIAGQDGMQVIADIAQIKRNYDFHTENLIASVRHVSHLLEAAKLGADIATVPYKVIKEALVHPMTDIGLQGFLTDWAKVAPPG
ncbi:MAG: transaldolase family protein [Anaerolineales bacterium]|jgi:transaldolase